MKAAIKAGAVLLGENYAEEGLDKIIALKNESGVEWHMIGHVQSRKAELVANHFDLSAFIGWSEAGETIG